MTIEEREKMPERWIETTLGETLLKIVGGGTPSKAYGDYFSGEIPFMTVKDMKSRFPELTQDHITSEAVESSATTVLEPDTIVIATRMALGRIARPKISVAINQDLKALYFSNAVSKTYFEYWWKSSVSKIESLGTGTTVKGIRIENITSLDFPLPPLAEQIRIADKLDALLSRVDTGRERLERMPKLVKRFRQSVLSVAVSGELTREWRGGGDTEWTEQPFAKIASIRGGTTAVPQDQTTDYPVLRSSSIKNYSVDLADVRYITSAGSNSKNILIEGDLLFTRLSGSIEYVANCAVVRELNGQKIEYPDRIFCAKVNKTSTPEFIAIAFSSNEVREPLVEVAKSSAGHQRISIQDLLAQVLKLPPLPEQAEIVRRVEVLFALADRLEARAQAALAHYSRLTPALLAKAFRGELVPQDPADEPASVLLERIRAVRETAAPAKKAQGRGRKPGTTTPRAEDGAGAGEAQAEPKRGRGRPRKVVAEAGQTGRGIPVAASAEEAIRLLQERARAEREGRQAVQVGLFGNTEAATK